jgi:outer membrane protein OmpA-like peptidoglycan-associated protein
MRTGIGVISLALAVSASGLQAEQGKGPETALVKSVEQVRCELFSDTPEGKSACGATRAWITRTGATMTDPDRIREQVDELNKPKARPLPAGRNRGDSDASIVAVKESDLFINFDMDSADISDDAYSQASNLFAAMSGVAGWQDYNFEIGGHTDAVGSASYNQELSLRRARAVADLLVARGVDRSHLVVKGYGFTRPIEGLSRSDGLNRRVEITRLN